VNLAVPRLADLRADLGEGVLWAKLAVAGPVDGISIARGRGEHAGRFSGVKVYCVFVGYPRSGHSLIGSLIDAHPNALVSHRLDSLKYVQAGASRTELFARIARNSERFAASGRGLTRYSYAVPDQWQGRDEGLVVVGDQEGKGATERMAADPALLTRLLALDGVDVRFLHVVRNPYDNIATWARRLNRTIAETTERYFLLCDAIERLRSGLPEGALLDVWHERFVADPEGGLREICGFLGLPVTDDYVRDCARIVFEEPRRTRHSSEWTPASVETVARRAAAIDFLAGYTVDD
jgi:hypothetical protein